MKSSILLIPLCLCAGLARAQSIGPATVNSAGAGATIGSTELEWSIGEMTMISTFSSPAIIVTQGVLQPGNGPLDINNTVLLQQLQVFPNPASTVVNIQYSSQAEGVLGYQLTDMAGKVIMNRTITVRPGKNTEQIKISDLAVATYMLEVTTNPGSTSAAKAAYKIDKLQ
jgi:hypothetical protein